MPETTTYAGPRGQYTVTCNTDDPEVTYASFDEALAAANELIRAEFGQAEISWHQVDPEPGSLVVTHVSACRGQWTGIWVVVDPLPLIMSGLPGTITERLGAPDA